jgi:hypothetical protein
LPEREFWLEGARLYTISNRAAGALSIPIQTHMSTGVLYESFFSGEISMWDELPGTHQQRLEDPSLRADGSREGAFRNNQHLLYANFSRLFAFSLPRPSGLHYPFPLEIYIGANVAAHVQTFLFSSKTRMGMNINADLGALVRLGVDYDLDTKQISRWLNFGACVKNVFPTSMMWIYANDPEEYTEPVYNSQFFGISYIDKSGLLNANWIVGASIHRSVQGEEVVFEEDTIGTRVYVSTYHVGLEAELFEMVSIRGGLSDMVPCLGAGIRWRNFRLDYTFRFDTVNFSPVQLGIGVLF